MRSLKFLPLMCAMMLVASFKLFADALVDDCEGTNQDKFGYYWYFYDDNKDAAGAGSSTIPGVTKDATGEYVVAPTAAAGHTGGGIVLPYSLGPTKVPCGAGCGFNYVGAGAMLCATGSTIDLTGATSITFWLKTSAAVQVDFMVNTKEVETAGDFGYFHALVPPVPVANTWTQVTVSLVAGIGGVTRPAWAEQKNPGIAFNIKSIEKLQWQMHSDQVLTTGPGQITLDDIWIKGTYVFVPPDLCSACAGAPNSPSSPSALLSNFDKTPLNIPSKSNARGFYWFCYNDGAGRTPPVSAPSEFSAITGGVDPTADPLLPPMLIIGANGYNATNGADIKFTLGPAYKKNSTDAATIQPFVGLGTNLWDDKTSSENYNASADGATGVYFDYMLSSSDITASTVLRCEMYANLLAVDGSVHYIDLPATGAGVWKGASIPFDTLVQPAWGTVTPVTFDPTIMKKIQWAVQSKPGTTGELAIDNVYMIGATKITPAGSAIKYQFNQSKSFDGFKPSIFNNTLKVTFTKGMSNATITLVNTKGAIVARNFSANNLTAQVDVAGLAKGVYMLVVKANAKAGIEFNRTVPVTVY